MKINKWHHITFLDHMIGLHEPIKIETVIYVLETTDKYVYGTTWLPVHGDKDIVKDNYEKISIIKSTILKKKCLRDL